MEVMTRLKKTQGLMPSDRRAEKRNRSWQVDTSQLREMVDTMVRVSVMTPHGLHVGSCPAFGWIYRIGDKVA
jgi:hypothetical protein